jgi:cardiolipin synthase
VGTAGSVAIRAAGIAVAQAAGVAAVAAAVSWRDGAALAIAAWTLAGGAMTAAGTLAAAPWFRDSGGESLARPGVANSLTLLRFVLIAPVCFWLLHGRPAAAIIAWLLLGATDIADGVWARNRREISRFGVMVDPLADVASTFAVYTVFRVDNLVPLWLYLLLVGRYAMLLAGSAVVTRVAGPIPYRATAAGKIVGVVQAVGALILMASAAMGRPHPPAASLLYGILGLGFASVIVSQGVIGWQHVRRGRRGRAIGSGSSR